jgi:hypothetical protein
MALMRSLVSIALAGAIFGSLSVAARSDDAYDSVVGKSQTSLKRIVVPNQKMMRRDPGIVSLLPVRKIVDRNLSIRREL